MAQFCTVTRALNAAHLDGWDDDTNPDIHPVHGEVTFTPIIPEGDAIQLYEDGKPKTIVPLPITVRISDGEIFHRGETSVKLLAGGDRMNPPKLYWRASFAHMQSNGIPFKLKPIQFEAIPDGTVDLTAVAPVVGIEPPTTKGRDGDTITGLTTEGANVIVTVRDADGVVNKHQIAIGQVATTVANDAVTRAETAATAAAKAVAIAQAEKPLSESIDVAALVAENRASLTASHPYADPSEEQVSEVLNAVRLLMRGKTATAPNGMEIIEGYSEEANRNVRVLRSIPGNGLYWGMWVFPINFTFSGIVEAPHPVFDADSDDIACKVWSKSPKGTVLAVAGSHRTNPDGTDPRDVAHNTNSMWHRVTTAIAQPGLPEFQLHGFGDDSMPGVGAVVSSGSSPLSAGVIRTEAFIAAAGITTARQWDGSATKLIGMSNIQGDAAAVRGNPFLHIELSKSVRDSHDAFVDAVVSAGFLAGENGALLTNEFPKAVGSVNGRGSSMTAARADHTHRLVQNDPADGEVVVRQSGGWRSVPAQSIGAVPQNVVDAATQVEAATYSATAGSLMKRTSTGAVSVATPTAGSHAANKSYVDGATSAKADLVGGRVPTAQIPAVALTKPFVVSDRAGMLGLTAEEGDVAVITSGADKGTYMLGTGAADTFSSWVRLASPDGAVSSVNGQTGVVNLSAADVGAAPVPDFNEVREVVTNFLLTATPNPTPGVVVARGQFGTAQVADPREAQDAATKNYVDQRTPQIKVVSSMPSTPDANTLYVVI